MHDTVLVLSYCETNRAINSQGSTHSYTHIIHESDFIIK